MAYFTTAATDISLGATGAWTDIDLSSYVPATTSMVAIAVSTWDLAGGPAQYWGIRCNGSTDDRTFDEDNGRVKIFFVKVDANRIIEGKIEHADINFFLLGYWTDDAVGLTNGVDLSLGAYGAWTDIDCSATIPGGGDGAFWEVTLGAGTPAVGLRKNGSTDNRVDDGFGHQGAICGVDANRVCEGYAEDADVDFYLIGYLVEADMKTNAYNASIGALTTWTDIDYSADSSSLTHRHGAAFEIITTEAITGYTFGFRKNGSSDAYYGGVLKHQWYAIGDDGSAVVEGYIADTDTDFFIIGYFRPETFTKAETDTFAIADSIEAARLIDVAIAEAIAVADALSPPVEVNVLPTDTFTMTDRCSFRKSLLTIEITMPVGSTTVTIAMPVQ